ncbi:apolipoprotein N-acyltransferase [bacterium]|nr:apolipoprotein N-acyltransferase [bacterium]
MGGFHLWIFAIRPWTNWGGVLSLWLAFTLFQALFYGIMGGLFGLTKGILRPYIGFPVAWIIGEWLRSLGPLGSTGGWLGYTQTGAPLILQTASIWGTLGLTALCVTVNWMIASLVYTSFEQLSMRWAKIVSGVVISVTLLILIPSAVIDSRPAIPVAVVQGNHTQHNKQQRKYWPMIKRDYLSLTRTIPNQSWVFWPETVIPTVRKDPSWVKSIDQLGSGKQLSLFLGSPVKENGDYYNTVLVDTPSQPLSVIYRKQQLMPFGEYLPSRDLFRKFKLARHLLDGADYSPATPGPISTVNGIKVGSGICLESIYPSLFRAQTLSGAEVLTVYANNAWFFDSSAAAKHLQMSQLRAVENRRYLVQSANTGLSAIIDPFGAVKEVSELNKRAILTGTIHPISTLSFFSKYGHWLVVSAWMLLGVSFGRRWWTSI